MKLKYRRLIYIIFIVLFLIAAVWLLLYTQGYTYNFNKNRLEQTGNLKIVTDPNGANITLNHQLIKNQSPYIVKGLLPDSYLTEIKLPGFQLWSKNVKVEAGQLSNTGKIILWPDEQAGANINNQPANLTALSPNHNMLAYQINGGLESGLWILNLSSGETSLLQRTAQDQFDFMEWSPDSRRLMLHQKKSYSWYIHNLTDDTKTALPVMDNLSSKIAHWSENNNNIIYFATEQEIYQLDIENKKAELLQRLTTSDFRHHQGLLYMLAKNGQGTVLKVLNLKNLQILPSYSELPASTDFIFQPSHNNWLPLLDKARHQLYLLTSPLTSLKYLINLPEVINLDWLNNSNILLLSNNYETWSFNTETEEKKLIYRISQPLQFARWYDEKYVLLVADKVYALELDTLSSQQKWPLTSAPSEIKEIITDSSKNYLTIVTTDKILRLSLKKPANVLPPAN